jgi:hypothetical protein
VSSDSSPRLKRRCSRNNQAHRHTDTQTVVNI